MSLIVEFGGKGTKKREKYKRKAGKFSALEAKSYQNVWRFARLFVTLQQ